MTSSSASAPLPTPSGVGATALLVAGFRAAEAGRPAPWFDDSLAAHFLAAAPGWQQPTDDVPGEIFVATRTRVFDDVIRRAVDSGVRQIVVLGAGLDTRAFRLALASDVTMFEVDREDVLGFKEAVLAGLAAQPTCRRVPLRSDLAEDWPALLHAAGHDDRRPTAWIVEGVLTYLGGALVHRVLDAVRARSAPDSALAMTVPARFLRGAGTDLRSATDRWLGRYGYAGDRLSVHHVARSFGRRTAAGEGVGDLVIARSVTHRPPL